MKDNYTPQYKSFKMKEITLNKFYCECCDTTKELPKQIILDFYQSDIPFTQIDNVRIDEENAYCMSCSEKKTEAKRQKTYKAKRQKAYKAKPQVESICEVCGDKVLSKGNRKYCDRCRYASSAVKNISRYAKHSEKLIQIAKMKVYGAKGSSFSDNTLIHNV